MTNTPARQSAGQSMAYWIGDEEVNGIIIGGMTQTYRFWHKVEIAPGYVIDEPVTGWRQFESDAEAVAWFWETYPVEYAKGAEMRVYE